jgi:hypothetical protein
MVAAVLATTFEKSTTKVALRTVDLVGSSSLGTSCLPGGESA